MSASFRKLNHWHQKNRATQRQCVHRRLALRPAWRTLWHPAALGIPTQLAGHTLTSSRGASSCTAPPPQLCCILPRPWVHLASKHQRHTVPSCLFCTLPRPKARLTSHNLGTQIGGKQARWHIAQAQGPFGKWQVGTLPRPRAGLASDTVNHSRQVHKCLSRLLQNH